MILDTPIENLKYVGKIYQPKLKKLGIKTIKDLLWHFPQRYEDWTEIGKVSDIKPNEKISLIGKVVSIENKRIFPRRLILTTASIEDDTGKVKAVWYNQPFLVNSIKPGKLISVSGKVKLDKYGVYLQNPSYEMVKEIPDTKYKIQDTKLKHTAGLIPVYPETEGLTSRYLRFLIKPLLKFSDKISEFLPEEIIERQKILDIRTALKEIHFPSSLEKADQSRKRFAFNELFLFQLKALSERRKVQQQKAVSVKFNQEVIKNFISSLSFELTGAQKIALWEILKDLEKPYPMNRLLNGDVGSGKTVVAAAVALEAAKAGYQTAIMAPTEVLANQHFQTFSKVLKDFDINIGLLTSSNFKESNNRGKILRDAFLEKIFSGKIDILIGTHSLIQKDVSFAKPVLVVIDEQHRFGVEQRATLLSSPVTSEGQVFVPHLLSMTATPIPRTLTLTVYGDLDISILDEMPKGRTPIETKLIPPEKRKEAYKFIREQVKEGRQTFVICPRIEIPVENQEIETKSKVKKQLSLKDYLKYEVKAVKAEYEKLSKDIFKDLRVAMLHGKMKSKEKEEIMAKFKNKESDILVSTSVIEVGVDVPNATIMMIEGAEKFGLAQLHQFRGRVGRGKHKSYCILFTESPLVGTTRRLEALLKTNNGFKLAEMDLKIRGPGEFTGTKQSGIPDLAMAFLADMSLIKQARLEAKFILKSLNKYPLVLKKLNEFNRQIHFE